MARKVRRIADLLETKCLDMPGAPDVIHALRSFEHTGAPPQATVRHHFIRQVPCSLRELQFNRFLLTALHIAAPDEDAKDLVDLVQRQWGAVTARQPMKVISHRGDGATFKKWGIVQIREEVDCVYVRENENSLGGTKKFLSAWINPSSQLSGVECDVALSADGVPFVTHEPDLWALMEQETYRDRKPALREQRDIRNHPAHEVPDRFLTLAHWLDLLGAGLEERIKAEDMARQRGDAVPQETTLRVELEMKQKGLLDSNHESWRSTNKVVSQFLKKTPQSHRLEVAMFCNSPVPLRVRNDMAADKTLLSHVVFGMGCKVKNGNLLNSEVAKDAQELRFGLHTAGQPALIDSGILDGKVVMFSPGQDHPGDDLHRQLEPISPLRTKLDVTIDQSIQSARLQRLTALIENRRAQCGSGPLAVHVLTDHGEQGARTILASGLAVARPDGSLQTALQGWDCTALQTMQTGSSQPRIDEATLGNALAEAVQADDPRLIGRLLLERCPEQQ